MNFLDVEKLIVHIMDITLMAMLTLGVIGYVGIHIYKILLRDWKNKQ